MKVARVLAIFENNKEFLFTNYRSISTSMFLQTTGEVMYNDVQQAL